MLLIFNLVDNAKFYLFLNEFNHDGHLDQIFTRDTTTFRQRYILDYLDYCFQHQSNLGVSLY